MTIESKYPIQPDEPQTAVSRSREGSGNALLEPSGFLPSEFLLDPGGRDYVGLNSYDASGIPGLGLT
jgi:hypothetical protein